MSGPSAGRPAQPAASRPATVDRARMVAWEVLRAVDERGAYANLLLPSLLARHRMSGRDRGFATELAYGALRAQGLLDGVLDTVTSRPVDSVDAGVRDALRLGTYQLLRTRVPARAAVATTVDLVRATSGERPVRFANAVLRRVADRVAETGGDLATLLSAPAFDEDPFGYLAVTTAHPRWIVEVVADALAGDLEETRAALLADEVRPAVHLVAPPDRIGGDDLLAMAHEVGLGAQPGRYSPFAVVLAGGDPAALPAIADGRASVQDEGSQLVTLALARTRTIGTDNGVTVDLCAGPGGKAVLLAALLTARSGPAAETATTDVKVAEVEAVDIEGVDVESVDPEAAADVAAAGDLDGSSHEGSELDLDGAGLDCAVLGGSVLGWPGADVPLTVDDLLGDDLLGDDVPGDDVPGDDVAGTVPTAGGAGVAGSPVTPVLLALEPRARRAALVTAALAGRPGALVVRADGRFPPLPPGTADRVLVDAPCTGLGALRRRPEARWRKLPADVAVLAGLQRQLLVSALDLVRPGGVVAYVTCSPHPAETVEVVRSVVDQRADTVILDARAALPGVPDLGTGPFAQLWPHRHGTDAMFLALLRRVGPAAGGPSPVS